MKTFYQLLILLLTFTIQLSAQKSQPKFGQVDKADLLMTDCDFDKGANAVILIDWGNTFYDRGTVGYSTFKTVLQRRIRIKILKEMGIAQADIEIPYYTHNNEERILKIDANTYNIDASGNIQTTEVKKSSIYSKRIDADYSKMIIAFPEVKVGSIIEYIYTIERETISLSNWYFQGRIPVRYSEYQLNIPQIFRFSVQPSVIDSIEDKHEVIDESISMSEGYIETKTLKSSYIMRNLQGIKNEPYMGSVKDYIQRLEFQLTQIYYSENRVEDRSLKWEDVIKNDLNKSEYFGLQLNKSVSASKGFVDEAKQISDSEARMQFIFNQVRKTINWNGDYHFYTANGIVKTWETKTGNTADINLLLVKLLNDADIKAVPMLFSTRSHGLTTPYYPSLSQFNTVMAYVDLNGNSFILDATDKQSNYKLVSEKVINTNGFILMGENGKWKDVLSGKSKYKVMAATKAEIDANGVMKGNAVVYCYDYARVERCEKRAQNLEKFNSDYFIRYYPSFNIEDIVVINLEADSLPLEQKVKFSSVLNKSGDYRYFPINIFSDLEVNPFIATTRVSDVDFGVQRDYSIFGNYTIPQEFTFDGVPESISIATSDRGIVFNRSVQVENNLINIRISLEFKQIFYPASSYPEFAAFYKKLFEALNEQVVIKKKTMP